MQILVRVSLFQGMNLICTHRWGQIAYCIVCRRLDLLTHVGPTKWATKNYCLVLCCKTGIQNQGYKSVRNGDTYGSLLNFDRIREYIPDLVVYYSLLRSGAVVPSIVGGCWFVELPGWTLKILLRRAWSIAIFSLFKMLIVPMMASLRQNAMAHNLNTVIIGYCDYHPVTKLPNIGCCDYSQTSFYYSRIIALWQLSACD